MMRFCSRLLVAVLAEKLCEAIKTKYDYVEVRLSGEEIRNLRDVCRRRGFTLSQYLEQSARMYLIRSKRERRLRGFA